MEKLSGGDMRKCLNIMQVRPRAPLSPPQCTPLHTSPHHTVSLLTAHCVRFTAHLHTSLHTLEHFGTHPCTPHCTPITLWQSPSARAQN
eukprot:1160559-Rhodomonas_salina.3